jgi:hypothetical protein
MPWSRRFVDPIPTNGKPIVTLQDAAQFILKTISAMPKAFILKGLGRAS